MAVSIGLSGRVAIVTGGGSGIGRATSLLLAKAGAAVGAADKNKSTAHETAELIIESGGRAVGVEVDVSDPEAAAAAVATTVGSFGPVDILVNNAAAWTVGLFKDITEDDYVDGDIGGSLVGTMVMAQAVFEVMRANGGGSIVNMISDSARVGEPFMVAYPLGRLGEPIDQANAILFFCSDMSSWVTGQVLSVNGGYAMVS